MAARPNSCLPNTTGGDRAQDDSQGPCGGNQNNDKPGYLDLATQLPHNFSNLAFASPGRSVVLVSDSNHALSERCGWRKF